MARTYWLDLFTGRSWEEFLAAGGKMSGFRRSRWKTVERIAPGDWLLSYVTGVSRWIGILEVTGQPFFDEDAERIYEDDVFPARLPVEVVTQLTAETAVPVTLQRDKLSFFQTPSPTGWTGHFRGSPAKMKEADAEIVIAAIREAAANPVERPFSLVKWNRRAKTIDTPDDEVTVPLEEDQGSGEQPTELASPVSHEEIQSLLLRLGSEMGFGLWVARNDRSKTFRGKVLGDTSGVRDKLPTQFDPATNRTIELIDVLWLDENAIVAAFEVEHTTQVYSGLLRMADLVSMQPGINIRLYIVAPDERREKVLSEISRPVFSRMKPPLRDRCQFIPYSELRAKEERLRGLAQYLRPEFLDEIAESAD